MPNQSVRANKLPTKANLKNIVTETEIFSFSLNKHNSSF